jgi:ribosomal subunit interface protein
MTLRVSGKNMNIGEALRTHVTDRLGGATAKYFDGDVQGHVTIAPEGSGFRSDCTLHLTSGITLQADGRAHDPYASFDQAAERMEKRLRRYKRRLKDHNQQPAAPLANGAELVSDYVLEAPDQETEAPVPEQFSPTIIAETSSRLTRMSVASAVIELDMTGAPVFVFRHDVSERVNLVYQRGDGNIGWIDFGFEDGAAGGVPAARSRLA